MVVENGLALLTVIGITAGELLFSSFDAFKGEHEDI